jgi:hypothetical protein
MHNAHDGLRVALDFKKWFEAVQVLVRPHETTAIAAELGGFSRRAAVPFAPLFSAWMQEQFARERLRYLFDPNGQDLWWSPSATMHRQGGDCEDLSILACSVLLAAMRPSTLVFGLLNTGTQWMGHAWVEGCDEQGGFLLESTTGQMFRRSRPDTYRATAAISKGHFSLLTDVRGLRPQGRGFGRLGPVQ